MPSLLSNIRRAATLLFGRGFGSLRASIGLGLLSLALAVTLWAFVTEEENPTETDCAAGDIPVETVNIPEDLAVAGLSDVTVSVRAEAPRDICDDLAVSDFRAVADLSLANARENSVTLRVSSTRSQVDVILASPSVVTVTLEPVTTKVVPVSVKLIGTPPLGYATVPGRTTPEQVEVAGAESLVALVQEAVADVNVQGVRVPVEQVFPLVPRDSRGGDIEGVTLNPGTAEVVLPIVQRQITQAYVVTPLLAGTPADGFNVTSISVEPQFAVITGTIEALQSLTTVTTDQVDVDGAASDVVRAVGLQLPPDLAVEGGDTVTVRVAIAPAQGEIGLGLTPEISGLGPGLRAELATTLVEVHVAGEIPVLRALSPSSLTAVVDVSGLQAGQHAVPVQVTAPPGIRVVSVAPDTMIVTVSAA